MKRFASLLAAALLTNCTTPQQRSEADLRAASDLVDQAASEMSPRERAPIEARAAQHLNDQMQAVAAACGTTIHSTSEPRWEDRTLFVGAGATPEQLACVQKTYAFVKASPK